jgi:hypothetical protein
MRVCVVATALVVAAMWSAGAHAQSRVSVELGGMVSAYDVQSSGGTGVTRGAIRVPDSSGGTGGNAVVGGGAAAASQGIAAFEVRPTVSLESGFLMGIGFRVGQAGLGDVNSSLVGADVSLGFQHKFGPFMPFLRGIFGLNSYDIPGTTVGHQTDLRLDAELGSRLYLGKKIFVAAAAFAGFGDRYGAAVSVGGDVVQIFRRGVMP